MGEPSLTEFLLAQIAEDEVVARAAIADDGGSDEGFSGKYEEMIRPPSGIGIAAGGFGEAAARMIATHAVPARALAECEAKRRIVEWHSETEDCCEERYGPLVLDAESEWSAGTDSLGQLSMRQSIGTQRFIGCVTLMHLAAIYSDHPDYREEWKP